MSWTGPAVRRGVLGLRAPQSDLYERRMECSTKITITTSSTGIRVPVFIANIGNVNPGALYGPTEAGISQGVTSPT